MISQKIKPVKHFAKLYKNFLKTSKTDGFMRIDKFLKVTRILKRRSVAKDATDGGKVKVNGRTVKPSYQIKIGDVIELGYNTGTVCLRVKDIKETVRKEEAETLYEIIGE